MGPWGKEMITVKLNGPLAGFAVTPARPGERVMVQTTEFLSSEDGDLLINRLEEISRAIFPALPMDVHILESSIDHLLILIQRDGTAEIYINEPHLVLNIKSKRDLKKGEYVTEDDIADIDKLKFENVQIPEDTGVIFVFSKGWRKGLFYDLSPLSPSKTNRDFDIEETLGSCFTYLIFQHLFKISDSEFKELFSQGWFPFFSLKQSTIQTMLNHMNSGWSVDDILPQIANELLERLAEMMECWEAKTVFQPHLPFFQKAIERYKDNDYLSTTSNLYPRIEGLLRSQTERKPHQGNLAKALASKIDKEKIQTSLFLPHMFEKYLREVYFKDFKPGTTSPLSRHSVSHGVAEASDFSLKSATIAFLIIDQIFYHLP